MLLKLFFLFNPQILVVEQLPQNTDVLLSKRKFNEISVARIGPDLWLDSSGVQ